MGWQILENPIRDGIIGYYFLYPIAVVLTGLVTLVPLTMSLMRRKRALVPVWVSCGILLPPMVVLILRVVNQSPFSRMEIDSGDFLVPYTLVQLVFMGVYGYYLVKNRKTK